MSTAPLWYAGRCSKRQEHDPIVMIEVVGRHDGSSWTAVENVQKLFPKTGEVELRAADTKLLRSNEWVAFTLNAKSTKHWTASTYRKLPRYADLSHLGSLEKIRHELSVKGLQTSEPGGTWIVRLSEDRVAKVDLRRVSDMAFLSAGNAKVNLYAYEASALVRMPSGETSAALYDAGPSPAIVEAVDWSPDVEYACRVMRSLSPASNKEVETAVAYLERHAQETAARVSANASDIAAAYQALRSGELAKRLSEDRQLMQDYMAALAADPKISALIQLEVGVIGEKERGQIQAKLAKQLEHELQATKAAKVAAIVSEAQTLAAGKVAKIEHECAAKTQAAQAALQRAEIELKEQKAKLEREIEAAKVRLDKQVNELSARRQALQSDVDALANAEIQARARAASLAQEEDQLAQQVERAAEELERFRAAAASVSAQSARTHAPAPSPGIAPWRQPERGEALELASLQNAIDKCPLLCDAGKQLMGQFMALTLAGEVPVLVGKKVDDFLWVAEALVSNGVSARLEADPLMIAYDDLWIRAGIGISTPIAQALALAEGDARLTSLAVIERAERSGARFWYPALVDRARRGDLSRRLLLCVTLEDTDCEEAKAVLHQGVHLNVDAALVGPAATIAVNMLGLIQNGELNPGEQPPPPPPAVKMALSGPTGLSIRQALRVARAAAEHHNFAPQADLSAMAQSLIRLFSQPETATNAL